MTYSNPQLLNFTFSHTPCNTEINFGLSLAINCFQPHESLGGEKYEQPDCSELFTSLPSIVWMFSCIFEVRMRTWHGK